MAGVADSSSSQATREMYGIPFYNNSIHNKSRFAVFQQVQPVEYTCSLVSGTNICFKDSQAIVSTSLAGTKIWVTGL